MLTDGASAVLVTSEDYAKAHGLKPLARIRSIAVAGCAPEVMGLGPIGATRKALKRAGITSKDLDVVELNEVHGVCRETGDAGGIHTGRDYTWQGNVIRDNYWHDLRGPGLHGVTAVYLDDFASGFEVTLDCPNNRYINDEQICQAVAAMWARPTFIARRASVARLATRSEREGPAATGVAAGAMITCRSRPRRPARRAGGSPLRRGLRRCGPRRRRGHWRTSAPIRAAACARAIPWRASARSVRRWRA